MEQVKRMQQTLKQIPKTSILGSALPIQCKTYVGLSRVELTHCVDTLNACDSLPPSISHRKENGFEK